VRTRHVIHVDPRAVTLWLAGRSTPLARASTEAPGPLLDALTAAGGPPVAVLVDILDEEHQRATVPPVGRLDRAALLERRLARTYGRTPLRTVQAIGRDATGQDLLVLSALTRPEPLQALLAQLRATRLPVTGVFSPALLTAGLIRRLGIATRALLLVTRQSDGSLRHTLLRDGHFTGSRLLHAGVAAGPADGSRLVTQVEESMRYFDPAFASAGIPLEVLVLVDDGARLPLPTPLPDYLQIRLLTTSLLQQRLKLSFRPRAEAAEAVFIALLQAGETSGDFAPATERRYFHLWQGRTYGRYAALVLATLAFGGAALNILGTVQSELERRAIEPQLAAIAATGPASQAPPVDAAAMRQGVETLTALSANGTDPAAVLGAIAEAVAGLPDVQIDAVDWRRSGPSLVAADTTATAGSATADESATEAGDADALADATTAADDASNMPGRILVTVRGHIAGFDGDYPQAFSRLEAFVRALQGTGNVSQVRTTTTPLDVDSRSTLAGEVTREGGVTEAPFVVQLTMDHDHA
jgi:hypothetical protein